MSTGIPPQSRGAPVAGSSTTGAAGYVVALGAANLDTGASVSQAWRPGDSMPGRVHCTPGGVARNVAENCARLGLRVELLAPVGDDLAGQGLLAATRAAGVGVEACWVRRGAATSSYVSLHDAGGEMVAAVNDMAILDDLGAAELAPRVGLMRGAAAVLLDCNLPAAALEWVFAQLGGVPLFIEPVSGAKCRRVLPWLGRVHTLKANRLEAEALCGRAVQSDAEVEGAARWLHAQGVRQVVLSLGPRGAFRSSVVQGDTGTGWQHAVPTAVLNATGAGDALMAGLLRGHLRGEPLEAALRFGSACAALTLRAPGANSAELSETRVLQLLEEP